MTDAGVRLDPQWLEALIRPLADDAVAVSAGFFLPDPQTVFEVAMGATVLPAAEEIRIETFLPSSRSIAFRKRAWEAVGGYPEWLDYCEDLVFALALRAHGLRFTLAPEAIARFRPRRTLRAFWHQYFRYARGDGKAALWTKRHAIRYGTYGALIALVASGKRGKWLWPAALVAMIGYLRRPYKRLIPQLPKMSTPARIRAVLLVPIIRGTGDFAKMCGYPVGVLWRVRTHGWQWSWRMAAPHTDDATKASVEASVPLATCKRDACLYHSLGRCLTRFTTHFLRYVRPRRARRRYSTAQSAARRRMSVGRVR